MYVGMRLAGVQMVDAMGKCMEHVLIGADGWGEFPVDGGSVSVWVLEKAGLQKDQ